MRSGRFDMKIKVDLPDAEDRKELIEVYSSKYNLSNNINEEFIKELSKDTTQFTGADIELLYRESAIKAINNGCHKISKHNVILTLKEIIKQKHNTNQKFVVYHPEELKTKLSNVIGNSEAKGKIKNVIEYIRNPKKYKDIGIDSIYNGILFYGPPGTGKTLLAKAIAGEVNSTFIQANGTDFKKIYIGEGPALIREIFELARKYSSEDRPTIIFIDEIDAIAMKRSASMGGGGVSEANAIVNTLLTEMGGFQGENNVIVIAATNMNPKNLDPALMRSGRFDVKIKVNLPNKQDRQELLNMYSSKYKLNKDVNKDFMNNTAGAIKGFSGADIELLMREAAMIAINRNDKSISQEDIAGAIVTIKGS